MHQQKLAELITRKTPPAIIDVRTGIEFARGHIPGAIHAPTWKILLGISAVPPDREVDLVVLCELGPRARIVKSLLGLLGYRKVQLLDGHMAGWRRSGLPQERRA